MVFGGEARQRGEISREVYASGARRCAARRRDFVAGAVEFATDHGADRSPRAQQERPHRVPSAVVRQHR
jgi:hypothetical protein